MEISKSCHQMDYIIFKQTVNVYFSCLRYDPLMCPSMSVLWWIGRTSLKGALLFMFIHKKHTLNSYNYHVYMSYISALNRGFVDGGRIFF